MYKLLIPLFALALLVMGCTPQQSPAEPETTDAFAGQLLHGSHRVVLKTSLGDITLKLDADAAPKTVTNFVALAQTGYYNGLTFHRVIPDFMIQGGDPEGNGTGGESIFGVDFEDEISAKSYTLDTQKLKDVSEDELPAELQEMTLQEYYELQGYRYRDDLKSLPMDRGALAMANSGPNTNGSQFFIIQREGGTPWLEGRHTVFGVVVEGMDVVDAIANVERGANDQPLTPVTFSVEIL